MEKSNKPNHHKHLTATDYPTREGSHLREVLKTFLHQEYLATFRDPTSPNWEIPPNAGEYWTPERWKDIGTGVLEDGALTRRFDVAQAPEGALVWAWVRAALVAWEANDHEALGLLRLLAKLRLDAWSMGDKRRGIARERAALTPGELRLDALATDASGRRARALEVAREVQVFRAYESARVNDDGRSRESDRRAQALAHAGAAIAAAAGARMLFERAIWLQCIRRALLAILAAAASLEADAAKEAGHTYPLEQRRQTARDLLVNVYRRQVDGLQEPHARDGQAVAEPSDPLAARAFYELRREGWPAQIARDYAITATLAAPMCDPALAARAVRLRGWYANAASLHGPPLVNISWDPTYSEAEAEDAAPEVIPRTKKGRRARSERGRA